MPGSQQTLLVTGYRNRPKGILQKPALKALTVIWDHYYWFGFKKWRPSQISEDSQVSGCQLAKNEETHSPLPLTVDIKRDRQLFFIPSKSTHWWAPSVSREANQEQEPPHPRACQAPCVPTVCSRPHQAPCVPTVCCCLHQAPHVPTVCSHPHPLTRAPRILFFSFLFIFGCTESLLLLGGFL